MLSSKRTIHLNLLFLVSYVVVALAAGHVAGIVLRFLALKALGTAAAHP